MALVEIPDGLHAWLVDRAEQAGVSMETLVERCLLHYQAEWIAYEAFIRRAFWPITTKEEN